MLALVDEHELLLFWVTLVVLLGMARLLGALMQRVGQPRVVGELAAGVLIGPSVFGRVFPDLAAWLFPGGAVESALLMAVAWLGIVLLMLVTGFETDLGLLRRLGRPAVSLSTGSLVLPLGLGIWVGWVMPAELWGEEANRLGFSLFIGVTLSISALPVIARIMREMNLMRRSFGQLTIAAAMANDLIGWLLLGAIVGVLTGGAVDVGALLGRFAAVLAFLIVALTIGQRGADLILRRAQRVGGFAGAVSATLFVAFLLGAITHALGVEAVLGALIAGIVLGRSRYQRSDVKRATEAMANGVFAPIFFATAGLHVDFAVLFEPQALLWTAIVMAVASFAKLVGSFVGARAAGLSNLESLATGIGLNARGGMGIVLAMIGLSLGALNEISYAMIVLLAIATSMAAPPLLRPVIRRLRAAPEEVERLRREQVLAGSLIAGARSALLPTRGGRNSAIAAHVMDSLLEPDAEITVLTIRMPNDERPDVTEVLKAFRGRPVEVRLETHDDPGARILAELRLGYGVAALGLNEDYSGSYELSAPIQKVLAHSPVPLLLVRHRKSAPSVGDLPDWRGRRILLGVTGTRPGRAAEEVAYRLAGRFGADVLALHVITRELRGGDSDAVERHLQRVKDVAASFGTQGTVAVRYGAAPADELLREADEWGADTIVLGTPVRTAEGRPFLGHGTEWLLEHARQTIVSVVFPAEEGDRD